MGSQVCCQQTPNYNFQESHKSSFSSIPSQPLKLSESVQQFLKKQRPYEKQLQNANLKYKLINGMLYHGETDFLGKPNGFGKLHHSDGSLFIGKFNNGMANGQGYYVEKNGAFYEGFISNNKADDPKGKYWNPNFSYIGGFRNNVFEGQGHILADDYQFKGVFKNGKKLSGIFKWTKHTPRLQRFAYKGTFDENQLFSGKGTLQTPVGKYQGSFFKNDKHGEGRFTFKNKLVYVGEYHKGVRSGGGILYNAEMDCLMASVNPQSKMAKSYREGLQKEYLAKSFSKKVINKNRDTLRKKNNQDNNYPSSERIKQIQVDRRLCERLYQLLYIFITFSLL